VGKSSTELKETFQVSLGSAQFVGQDFYHLQRLHEVLSCLNVRLFLKNPLIIWFFRDDSLN